MSASPNEDVPLVRCAKDDGEGRPRLGRARSDVPRIRPLPEGPLLVEGPAEIVMPDGRVIRCERPVMALCTCRRSLQAPFCDTSHRPRVRRRSGRTTGEAERS
ncbi:CDGSH iron-sulfur domain-containing protein [Streptomyces sp. NPDC015661]|uniref:CDGSH iron-sulfur domain-containing protein n=1 Tax=Streptomyces sp. NPDC015661 TaxID=3364961 RepID=UPI0036FD64E4